MKRSPSWFSSSMKADLNSDTWVTILNAFVVSIEMNVLVVVAVAVYVCVCWSEILFSVFSWLYLTYLGWYFLLTSSVGLYLCINIV